MKTLFTNTTVLSLTEAGEWNVIKNAYLAVDDDRIGYIGTERPEGTFDRVLDYTNKLLMPGLINTHCHAPMTLLRGLGSDKPLQVWLFDYMFPTEDRLRPEDIAAGSYLALLEMLSTGTTSFTDMYYITDMTADACVEAGIRANLCRPVQCFDPDETLDKSTRAKEAFSLFERRNGDGNGRILIDFSIHAEYTCTERIVGSFCEAIAGYKSGMHIHLSETKSEQEQCIARYGKTPAAWFRDLGAFTLPAAAAHCVWVSDADIDILQQNGVSVMHNPSSNMKLGSGFAPVEKMRKKGVNLCLGTDGAASNNNLNMFEELHLASVIHNGHMLDAEVMPPAYTLKMATVNGARLQRRPDTGVLREGFKADIIAVDTDKPHLYPNPDPLAALCYSAQGSDVCMTMVDGKILYENGEFLTLDRDKIMHMAKESCRYLYGA